MNNESAKTLSSILKRLAREIEKLSDSELSSLAKSSRPLLSNITAPTERHTSNQKEKNEIPDLKIAVRKLYELPTRAEGEAYLKSATYSRANLVEIAREIDLPINKGLTTAQLTDMIIEATIGYRTRSAAIRGHTKKQE